MAKLEIELEDIMENSLMMEENMHLLEESKYYKKINKTNIEITNKFIKAFNSQTHKVFDEYIDSSEELANCEKYLAYVIGMSRGIKISNNIKDIKTKS